MSHWRKLGKPSLVPYFMATPRTVIAIDHGMKRSGFAVADPLRITVEPLEVYHGPGLENAIYERITSLLQERDVGLFLVGYPRRLDGRPNARTAEVDRFVAGLRQHFPRVEVQLFSEHSTTREADSLLVESGYTGRQRKARRDSWSALVLLQAWLRSGEPRDE